MTATPPYTNTSGTEMLYEDPDPVPSYALPLNVAASGAAAYHSRRGGLIGPVKEADTERQLPAGSGEQSGVRA